MRDASVFLGLAQEEAFPCALGVDWRGCAKLRSDTSAGRLEKNERQQGICLERLHVPGHSALEREKWVLGAPLELCTSCLRVILVQLQCPILPGTIFHPAVSWSSISPGSVICSSAQAAPEFPSRHPLQGGSSKRALIL